MPKTNQVLRIVLSLACLMSSWAVVAANQLEGVRIWAAPESTRIVFDLGGRPDYSHFTLTDPYRLVVDLKQTSARVNFNKITNNSKLVKRVRMSQSPGQGILRLVVDLVKPVQANLFALPPTPPYGNRLVVDLDDSAVASAAAPAPRPQNPSSQGRRDVIVAIDAGHGGDDPGSIGPSGTHEKRVVLQISNLLAQKINATPGMRAVMTRAGDYFVNLNKRSELARKSKADLLISVHADAFTSPQPMGASVWVLSKRRANSEMGRWLEQKEKHSELLGGAGDIIQNTDSEQYLAMTLLDMVSDKSMAISHSVASDVLGDLGRVTALHKRQPESASFAVLKSPDIPSILVETGFISNPREEKLLLNQSHQEKLATAIHRGVVRYFEQNAPSDTQLAGKSDIRHSVARGESLSAIAQRYQVSVNSIKKANNLSSDVVRIGQKLIIPRA
jgi:N-acetylmuramoyl-L-alanine amidase